jgi:predicted transcriptional regulator
MGIPTPPSGQAGRRPRGALEREILACLAAAGGPLTPAQVLASLGDNLAYTTVMTTLSRLHEKGALLREPAGRAYAYSLTADPEGVRSIALAQRMRRLLETGGDRAGVLAHFVADLRPEDEQLLADLLAESRPPAPVDEDGPPVSGGGLR